MVCTGITTTTYDPPLTNTAQNITRTTTSYYLCIPVLGLPFIGSRIHQVMTNQACPEDLDLTLPGEDNGPGLVYQFNWTTSSPNTSTVESNGFVGARPTGERITIREGEVTAGRYQGYGFYQEVEGLQLNPFACEGDGISQTIGSDLLEFTAF